MNKITITLVNRSKSVFTATDDERMDLGISKCGYVTVYVDGTCWFKGSLETIRSIHYPTKTGNFVAYKRDW